MRDHVCGLAVAASRHLHLFSTCSQAKMNSSVSFVWSAAMAARSPLIDAAMSSASRCMSAHGFST
eukprot:3433048-Pyramimonas_sp.AAC.1